ncbi:glycosyltransferase family 2 protein [Sulfurospirillum cavolei]|uniref:glycosyltransferase family 2 protein n=1 Tax=Sulfurospirillum cavolei TaxID=366522 RepID=UPI000764BB3D|nr:glycosyltransferase family 2 protein [Sulfurospirillum cavolei]
MLNEKKYVIAICLSSYNGEKFLQQQLRSIANQSYELSKILLIARDDGSIDKSYEILHKLVNNAVIDVKLLNDRTNYGIKKSFEILMLKAFEFGVKYIMFCDQDDIWNTDKVEKTYNKMQELEGIHGKNIPLLVHSDLTVVGEKLDLISPSFWNYQHIDPFKDSPNRLLLHNVVTGCTMMINRALAEKVKTIPDEAIMHDWWIALVASIFGKIAYIDKPLMFYRQHGQNDTGAKKYGFYYVCKRLVMKFCTKKYTSQLDKHIIQANTFLEIYHNDLDDNNKTMLQAFQQFSHLSKLQKIIFLFKYKIWKNGFMRNLGLVVFA